MPTYLESVPQDLAVGREVMRISATDIDDGNNSRVAYSLERNPGYFRIDSNNGVIFLDKPIDMDPGHKFTMTGRAEDSGTPPRMTEIELEVLVVESHKKAPTFVDGGATWDITLPENYSNYTAALPNGVFKAVSNVPEDSEVIFTLVSGATEQTNKLGTFILETKGDTAFIKLGSALDYETINEYTLTLGVRNKHKLAAETSINVFVTDVNDHIPSFNFKEVPEGIVLENEPPGTPVMQVRAIDIDGTSANNIVSYKLDENSKHRDLFQIDKDTGNITTLREFDREENNRYQIKVIAYDNSPSALKNNGEPNTAELSFWINIGDKNDNPPVFTQKIYVAEEIPENANTNALVTEVKALDKDTASPVTYDILEGNVGDAFYIENTTGKIRVKNQLDYESITAVTSCKYSQASQGIPKYTCMFDSTGHKLNSPEYHHSGSVLSLSNRELPRIPPQRECPFPIQPGTPQNTTTAGVSFPYLTGNYLEYPHSGSVLSLSNQELPRIPPQGECRSLSNQELPRIPPQRVCRSLSNQELSRIPPQRECRSLSNQELPEYHHRGSVVPCLTGNSPEYHHSESVVPCLTGKSPEYHHSERVVPYLTMNSPEYHHSESFVPLSNQELPEYHHRESVVPYLSGNSPEYHHSESVVPYLTGNSPEYHHRESVVTCLTRNSPEYHHNESVVPYLTRNSPEYHHRESVVPCLTGNSPEYHHRESVVPYLTGNSPEYHHRESVVPYLTRNSPEYHHRESVVPYLTRNSPEYHHSESVVPYLTRNSPEYHHRESVVPYLTRNSPEYHHRESVVPYLTRNSLEYHHCECVIQKEIHELIIKDP
uniref:(California timema) hypothetical protein n=2 Tax=Timema TaxID=61471 RepID=A0A7R9JCV3_TIMCA|nr:unnamed protein product [Timema californicum]